LPVPRERALTYHPGLDGLRGLAVAAVLLFHQSPNWTKGAFLGVSTFFTLSGFLITTLLLSERRRDQNIDLRRFWGRRFRRLMPAAVVTLLLAAAYGAFAADPAQLAQLRGDLIASLFYVANWHFIATDQSYLDLFAAPSPVLHFWSLAIEEQFYLVFPLLTAGVLAAGRGSRRTLFAVLAGLTVVSTATMALLWAPGSFDRAYYGTGTRAAELLVGALAAIVLLNRTPLPAGRSRLAATWIAVGALVVTVACYIAVPQTSWFMYHGGFLLFACVTAVLITGLVQQEGPAAALLASPPFRLLGLVSYGVYLYHWPIYLWLDQARTGLSGLPLFALRLAVTLSLAVASYQLLEMPIRTKRYLTGRQPLVAVPAAMAIVVLAAVLVTINPPADPLAVIAEGEAEAEPPPPPPPQPGVDRPVRLLVVGDDRAADLLPGLERWSAAGGELDVQAATGFDCGDAMVETPVAPSGAGDDQTEEVETCEGWVENWAPILDDFDPDVVLLTAGDWNVDEILIAGGRPTNSIDDEGAHTWIRRRLQAATELLASRGAQVSYLPFPHPQTPTGLPDVLPGVFALHQFLGDAARGDDVQLLKSDAALPTAPTVADGSAETDVAPPEVQSWSDQVAAIIAPLLVEEGMNNTRQLGGTRIMMVGDSVSWFVGLGLEDWSLDSGEATVWNTGTWGCGVARGGEISTAFGDLPPMAKCNDWGERWKDQLEDFDPDVVVLLTGMWDLADRKFPDWEKPLGMGDPVFDDYVLAEYREAVDVLGSSGAEVVWLVTPCYAGTTLPGPLYNTAALDPDRREHLNGVILPRLLESRPELHTIDLFGHVCPDGKYVQDIGGIAGGRPDGVHFSRPAARWLADWLGPEILKVPSS
jgi:peptidoglycan/LPS O-acetylase OafA/YrhL